MAAHLDAGPTGPSASARQPGGPVRLCSLGRFGGGSKDVQQTEKTHGPSDTFIERTDVLVIKITKNSLKPALKYNSQLAIKTIYLRGNNTFSNRYRLYKNLHWYFGLK